MTPAQDRIDRGFGLLERLLEGDRELRAAFAASRPRFFGAGAGSGPDDLAARRHLEWFLLERVPDDGTPAFESLIERHPDEAVELDADDRQAFLGSHASVFEVTGVDPGRGMWLRDLASLGEYPMQEPEASQVLQRGDMIVGRIFPVGESLYHASRAAAFFRNADLLAALQRDLERARAGRRAVLRLPQDEIETMFFAAPSAAPQEEPVGAARRLLLEGGVERDEVEEILAELASEPFDAERPLPGAADVLGVVLDRLAFETAIDLEAAREILLRAWAELARKGPGRGAHLEPAPPPHAASTAGSIDVVRSIAEFDRKRRSGLPLEQVFRELERDLALDDAPEEDDDTPAPDFPGVVDAMIDEFLWETSAERGPSAARELESLRSFGRFASGVGVFDNLGARDLLAYTCYWLPESDELENAEDAQRTLTALQSFCRWAEEQQQVPLFTGFKSALARLNDSLPRIAEANRRRTRTSDRGQGELFTCLAVGDGSAARLRDKAGDEHAVEIDPMLAEWLRPGDRLRARRLDDGRLAVYCCYPPEAQALEA